MPELLYSRRVDLDWSDLRTRIPVAVSLRNVSRGRAPGAHVSGILRVIAEKIGKLDPVEVKEETAPWRVALGVAWEEFAFSTVLKDSDWQPGERTADGVSGNADGLYLHGETDSHREVDEFEPALDETKHTEKKLRTADEMLDEWLWQHQVRAYCHLYGVRVARWTVMFYRGDWRGLGPVCAQYCYRFSDKEIADSWRMILQWKDKAEVE